MLAVLLLVQFRLDRYVPLAYWLVVVAVSVFGTLMSELLTDAQGVAPGAVTALFAAGLGLVFAAWWAVERTLSLHTIVTVRREAFYGRRSCSPSRSGAPPATSSSRTPASGTRCRSRSSAGSSR